MEIARGVQLWSVKDEAARDLPGTLRRLADMGYEGVEFFGASTAPAPELKDMLSAVNLACCGWHVPFADLQDERIETTIAFQKALGNPYLIVPILTNIETLAGWREHAAFFNRIAAQLAREHLRIGYHNHRFEFETMEGKLPQDVFFTETDASVIMQLDIGHVAAGGADPVEVLERYPGRATTVHVKPFSRAAGQKDVKEGYRPLLGEDDLPWAQILRVCRHTGGTLWQIVEYESDACPRLEGVERCLQALCRM